MRCRQLIGMRVRSSIQTMHVGLIGDKGHETSTIRATPKPDGSYLPRLARLNALKAWQMLSWVIAILQHLKCFLSWYGTEPVL